MSRLSRRRSAIWLVVILVAGLAPGGTLAASPPPISPVEVRPTDSPDTPITTHRDAVEATAAPIDLSGPGAGGELLADGTTIRPAEPAYRPPAVATEVVNSRTEHGRTIQSVVDAAARPLDVVGSAARAERRGIGTDLPIGKGLRTRSDIDYTTASAHQSYLAPYAHQLPDINKLLSGTHNPFEGPAIRFEPGLPPRFVGRR